MKTKCHEKSHDNQTVAETMNEVHLHLFALLAVETRKLDKVVDHSTKMSGDENSNRHKDQHSKLEAPTFTCWALIVPDMSKKLRSNTP